MRSNHTAGWLIAGLRRHLAGVAVVLAALGLGPARSRAEITACGSDSTMHVVKALAAAFQKETAVSLRLEGGGSAAGVQAVQAGQAQVAFLSRALTGSEKQAGLVGVPYALDGVAVIVNQENPQTNITVAELKAFYTGAVTHWQNHRPLVLFNRNTDSGTRQVFQELVLGKEAVFTSKAAIKHDALLVNSVSRIPSSLAYTSLAEADQKAVKVLAINGVQPSAETLRNGSYPLLRTPTFATAGEPGPEVKAFIEFVLSPKGQAIVEEQKLVRIK